MLRKTDSNNTAIFCFAATVLAGLSGCTSGFKDNLQIQSVSHSEFPESLKSSEFFCQLLDKLEDDTSEGNLRKLIYSGRVIEADRALTVSDFQAMQIKPEAFTQHLNNTFVSFVFKLICESTAREYPAQSVLSDLVSFTSERIKSRGELYWSGLMFLALAELSKKEHEPYFLIASRKAIDAIKSNLPNLLSSQDPSQDHLFLGLIILKETGALSSEDIIEISLLCSSFSEITAEEDSLRANQIGNYINTGQTFMEFADGTLKPRILEIFNSTQSASTAQFLQDFTAVDLPSNRRELQSRLGVLANEFSVALGFLRAAVSAGYITPTFLNSCLPPEYIGTLTWYTNDIAYRSTMEIGINYTVDLTSELVAIAVQTDNKVLLQKLSAHAKNDIGQAGEIVPRLAFLGATTYDDLKQFALRSPRESAQLALLHCLYNPNSIPLMLEDPHFPCQTIIELLCSYNERHFFDHVHQSFLRQSLSCGNEAWSVPAVVISPPSLLLGTLDNLVTPRSRVLAALRIVSEIGVDQPDIETRVKELLADPASKEQLRSFLPLLSRDSDLAPSNMADDMETFRKEAIEPLLSACGTDILSKRILFRYYGLCGLKLNSKSNKMPPLGDSMTIVDSPGSVLNGQIMEIFKSVYNDIKVINLLKKLLNSC